MSGTATGNGAYYDCVVIGGGPAGSTTATVLAQHGRRVLLLEREPFPRYHIGESLMPYTWFTFERLGVLDWFSRAACPKKYSVQFVSTSGAVSQPFYFFETIKHECATTWQVVRSDFDGMLLANARDKGVEVRAGRRGARPRHAGRPGGRRHGRRQERRPRGVPGGCGRRRLRTRHAAGRPAGLEAARPGPEQDIDLHLLQGRGARPRPGRGRDDRRLHSREGLVLVHPAPQRRRQRRRRGGSRLSLSRHARPAGDLLSRGGGLRLDQGPPAPGRAHRAGAGHRGVQLPVDGDRRRRVLPRRRRVLLSRSRLLDRRLPGAQERRDGRRRDPSRPGCRRHRCVHVRGLPARPRLGAGPVPPARAVVL